MELSFQHNSLLPVIALWASQRTGSVSMKLLGYLICSALGLVAGYFFPAGAWSTFVSILVSYHLFLIWLVITTEHKTGFSLPVGPTILTHLACVAVVVTLGLGRHVIPFFGLIRYFIPALAPFECTWLFSANPAKLQEEKRKKEVSIPPKKRPPPPMPSPPLPARTTKRGPNISLIETPDCASPE